MGEHIGMAVAPLDDAIRNGEASSSVTIDGEERAYREIPLLLAKEDDYDRRKRLSDAQLPVLEKLRPMYLRKEEKSRELAKALGYDSYNALSEDLRTFSLDELARQCELILRNTNAEYRDSLNRMTVEFMDIPLNRFRRCDIPKFFQCDKFKNHFPPEKALSVVEATLKGMGIRSEKGNAVLIHDQPLKKKNPRAACYSLKVPDDVRLTVKPTGGVNDYETLLHEMGHAQHFSHTNNDLFEFKHLGDNTVTEAYAFLFEELIDDPCWIDEFIRMPVPERERYLAFRKFAKLYIVRRYAAKLLYEKRFHAGEKNPKELYRELLGRAYGFPLDEKDAERYLSDIDDFYYVADYLRAWFLKAQLEKTLKDRYGECWFKNPEAGAFLTGLWRYGQELNGDELARKLGYPKVTPDIMIGKITKKEARVQDEG
jgi:hypothetical protein